MRIGALERRLLERVLAPPPKLLFRERQLERALELVGSRTSFVVCGPVGTGKTTLALASTRGLEGVVYASCASARTYSSLRSKLLKPAACYVIDDYTMAVKEPRLKELIRSLKPKAVVVYPPVEAYEELEGLERIEMPPYTLGELEDICRERAARLALAVDEEDVKAAARTGFEHNGNVRVALMVLAERAAANIQRYAVWRY